MARRCDHCKHFAPTVFQGTSASGYGVWWGDCLAGVERGRGLHNLYLACEEKFERGPNGFDREPSPPDHRPYQYALMAFENEGGAVVPDWQLTDARKDPVEANRGG